MRMMSRIRKTPRRNEKKARSSWPVAYRWAAMGTLVAYSAVGTKTLSAAQAQELQRPKPRTVQALKLRARCPPIDLTFRRDRSMESCRFSSGLPDIPSRSRTSAFGLFPRRAYPVYSPPSRRFKNCWPIPA